MNIIGLFHYYRNADMILYGFLLSGRSTMSQLVIVEAFTALPNTRHTQALCLACLLCR